MDYSDTHVPRERGVNVGALDLLSRCVDGAVSSVLLQVQLLAEA